MNPSREQLDAARAWLHTTFDHTEWDDEFDDASIASLSIELAKVREDERETCRNLICEFCAADVEYDDGKHHFGLGNSKPCKAAAIQEPA